MQTLTARLTWSVLCLTLCVMAAPGQAQQAEQKAARAQEVLRQMRAALGGDEALKAVQSLEASGKYRGLMMGRGAEGNIKLEMLLPDKMLRTVTTNMGAMQMTRREAVNGDEVWADMKRDMSAAMGGGDGPGGGRGGGGFGGGGGGGGDGAGGGGGFGGGGGGRGGGRGGGGGLSMPGGARDAGRTDGPLSPEMRRQIHDDLMRLLVVLGFAVPSSLQLDYQWESEVPAKDGRADVLLVRGPEDFLLALFVDQTSHRPLAINYRTLQAQTPRSREEAEAMRNDPESRAPKLVEMQLHFEDYKNVSDKNVRNLWLPHKIIRTSNGQMLEELTLNKYKLNPGIKEKKFEQKN